MQKAIGLAELAAREGEVPVGALVVCGDRIISCGYNLRETSRNALRHAELTAIDGACRTMHGWRLHQCTLYVTLEPCVMCAGAIVNARIRRVVYGAADPKAGAFGSVLDLNAYPLNHKPEIVADVCGDECRAQLQRFFKTLRDKRKR